MSNKNITPIGALAEMIQRTMASKERIERIITREEAVQTCEDLPLPERFQKLDEWGATHLSGADEEWIYQ